MAWRARFLAAVLLAVVSQPAHASLIGDQVNATMFTQLFGSFQGPLTTTVGPGVEYFASYNYELERVTLDVDATSFTFTFSNDFEGNALNPDGNFDLGFLGFRLRELDFTPAQTVVGVTQTSSTFPAGTFDQVTVGPDFVRFDVAPGLIIPGHGTVWSATWQFITTTPEPGSAALLGLGLLGLCLLRAQLRTTFWQE